MDTYVCHIWNTCGRKRIFLSLHPDFLSRKPHVLKKNLSAIWIIEPIFECWLALRSFEFSALVSKRILSHVKNALRNGLEIKG